MTVGLDRIPKFMCQGGDFTADKKMLGTGGESIYGEKFEDEKYACPLGPATSF